ncbi:MAG: hypothetical protein AVDCRST_MAG77-5440, partial [uncultured Chloroflexi bacterium]
ERSGARVSSRTDTRLADARPLDRPGRPADRRGAAGGGVPRVGRCRVAVGGDGGGHAAHRAGHTGGRGDVHRDVGGHDGGDDAAERAAHDRAVRPGEPGAAGHPRLALRSRLRRSVAGGGRAGLRGERGSGGVVRDRDGALAAVRAGRGAGRRGGVPVQRGEAGVPEALPGAAGVPHGPVALRVRRHTTAGAGARGLLRRVLLGADGHPRSRRGDEPPVGAADRGGRVRGEAAAARRVDGAGGRRCTRDPRPCRRRHAGPRARPPGRRVRRVRPGGADAPDADV